MKNFKRMIVGISSIGLVGIFCALLCFGQGIRESYQDDVGFWNYQKKKDLKVISDDDYCYDEDYDIYGGGERIQNFSDLKTYADEVVKVRLNPKFKRKIYCECIFSEVQVIKTYQGDLKKGTDIHIFEPVNCTIVPVLKIR